MRSELHQLNGQKGDYYVKGLKQKSFLNIMLKKSFQEIYRILKPNGIAVIVYAHKSTEGWETLINSFLDSGLIMTGAWPFNTEMGARLRSHESAALASSIYIVARKMERQPTGFYNNVKEELKTISTRNSNGFGTKGSRVQISSSRQLVPPLRSLESMSR